MAISGGYVVKETATNLRRNLLMTIASMLVVVISLGLTGAALITRQAVNKQTARWRGGVELSVFMKPEASQSQIDAVKAQLDSMPSVKRYKFVDKPDAFKEMKDLFADQPNVVDTLTVDAAPPSYRVVPAKAELVDSIGSRFKDQPGVREVVYAKDAIRALVHRSNQLKLGYLVFSVVFLLAALVLIFTTIQLAIFSRRREIGVMKLVGATNWFIRVPFMAEGMFQGLVGAVLACGFVWLTRNFWVSLASDAGFSSSLNKLFVTSHETFMTSVVLLLVGAIAGAVGSAVAVRRFLDV